MHSAENEDLELHPLSGFDRNIRLFDEQMGH
jgi:hypothetical protein